MDCVGRIAYRTDMTSAVVCRLTHSKYIGHMSCNASKPIFRVSDQALHKLACKVSEKG